MAQSGTLLILLIVQYLSNHHRLHFQILSTVCFIRSLILGNASAVFQTVTCSMDCRAIILAAVAAASASLSSTPFCYC